MNTAASPASDRPNPQQIAAQLQRVLASPTFTRARRSSQLLQFLVDAALAGTARELKEYTIATAVFGRPETFDPRLDSLVRVEATRLRNRLRSYYEEANSEDDVEIMLPSGTYIPTFHVRTAPPPEPPTAVPLPRAILHHRRRLWLTLPLVLLALVSGALLVNGRLAERPFSHLTLDQHVAVPGEVLLSPALSPDRQRLYYATNREGGRLRLWRQRLGQPDLQPLTPADADSYDLDLSPDGSWLAYYSSREGGAAYQQRTNGGPELLVASHGRSPRFSPDGLQLLYWVEDPHTRFGRVFTRRVSRDPRPEEPVPIAGEFMDAHDPQWTPDGRVLVCGTLRTNVTEAEHDLWIVSPGWLPGAARKTGILPFLKTKSIELHPGALRSTSFRFHQNSLLFTGLHRGRARLFALRLSDSFQPQREPLLLHDDAASQGNPSLRGDRLAFTSLQSDLHVWSIPLTPGGAAAGEPRRLTAGSGEEVFPALSSDGRQMVYLSLHAPATQLWRKDLASGVETEIHRGVGINRLKAAANGATAFVRVLRGQNPQLQAIDAIDLRTGEARQVCADCGAPTSVSPAADFVVHETGSAIARLAVLHVSSGSRREILRHPHHGVQSGRISPDGRWIAFELERGPDGGQLFIAPFHGLDFIPESAWIPVTTPSVSCFEPAWSPTGAALYFLSDRNGSRDLWMQPLQTGKQPSGPATLVYRFANPHLTPLTYHTRTPRYVGLSIGPREAVLTLAEMSSAIWLGRLEG